MELLYVWIEEYNNIKQQGFNFSPKHKFEFKPTVFDENNKVTGGTLTHDDINPNYPNNFFGKSISNITAIVGKNGSGKSSLLNFFCQTKLSNSVVVIYDDDELNVFIYSDYKIGLNGWCRSVLPINDLEKSFFECFCFTEACTEFLGVPNVDFSIMRFLMEAEGANGLEVVSNFKIERTLQQIQVLSFMQSRKFEDSLMTSFKVPNKLIVKFNINSNLITERVYLKNDDDEMVLKLVRGITTHLLVKYPVYERQHDEVFFRLKSFFLELFLLCDKVFINENSLEIYCGDEFLPFHEIHKVIDMFRKIIEIDNLLKFTFEWEGLSSGENVLLDLFCFIYTSIKFEMGNLNNIIKLILIDEIDISLHPEWQKGILKELISFMELIPTKMQLLISTHSPILLSDLPRENIIFLDKDANGNCLVKEPEGMDRTFGANIHSLYRSSFFMDGLMGTFAKEKIDGVIKDLNGGLDTVEEESKETRKNEMDYIIGQIGEPVIQGMLRKKYNDKFHSNGSLNERILKLEEELAYLKMKSNDSN